MRDCAGDYTHTDSHRNSASSSGYSHAQAPPDTDGAAHFATSPDTAATSSYNYAYRSATAHSPSSPHAGAASTFPAAYSLAAAQSLRPK